MSVICNAQIEPGVRLFEVSMIQFGTVNRAAARKVVKVLATTAKGARQIIRARYPRSGSYEVLANTPSLFDV